VKEKDVVDMSRRLGTSELSLDQPQSMQKSSTDIHDGPTLGESLAGEAVPLEDELAHEEIREQMRDLVAKFRATLTPRDQLLLDKRILPDEPATLQEIGDQWNISRERVRQLEARVMQKLKKFVDENNPGLKLAFRE
jgi:RNA polymerase sigma-32 factor